MRNFTCIVDFVLLYLSFCLQFYYVTEFVVIVTEPNCPRPPPPPRRFPHTILFPYSCLRFLQNFYKSFY